MRESLTTDSSMQSEAASMIRPRCAPNCAKWADSRPTNKRNRLCTSASVQEKEIMRGLQMANDLLGEVSDAQSAEMLLQEFQVAARSHQQHAFD